MEAITIVCDYGDGRNAAEQVAISVRGRRWVVDLCEQHLRELTKNAQAPRRGRRPKVAAGSVPKRRGRPPGSKNKTSAKNGRRKPARGQTGARKSSARARKRKATA